MPQLRSRAKNLRQSRKRKLRNAGRKRTMKEAIKAVSRVIENGDAEATAEALRQAQQAIDKAAKQGILTKNTASRRKSLLVRMAKAAGE
jgi:small subunit ribosomal protein S20